MFLDKDEYQITAWHVAARNGQIEILHKLWDWAKEVLTQKELNKLLLNRSISAKTAWQVVAEEGRIEVLPLLWESAKKVLTQERLNNIFLAKDEYERTAWHVAEENVQNRVITQSVGVG
jgi:ankyrin repeat protein